MLTRYIDKIRYFNVSLLYIIITLPKYSSCEVKRRWTINVEMLFCLNYQYISVQELTDINRMIRQGCVSRKRAFTMEGDVMMSPPGCDSPSKRACPENGGGGGGPDSEA